MANARLKYSKVGLVAYIEYTQQLGCAAVSAVISQGKALSYRVALLGQSQISYCFTATLCLMVVMRQRAKNATCKGDVQLESCIQSNRAAEYSR